MRVTFIVRNVTDVFWMGNGDTIKGVDNMAPREAFNYLSAYSRNGTGSVSMKIGTNQFRDKVELNQILREFCIFSMLRGRRRGYELIVIHIKKAMP